uniref:Uncharacterized protein n=1 Tax=Cucumis sativus TaxID=3659 RepID=A0A0A0LFN5_CUCSA
MADATVGWSNGVSSSSSSFLCVSVCGVSGGVCMISYPSPRCTTIAFLFPKKSKPETQSKPYVTSSDRLLKIFQDPLLVITEKDMGKSNRVKSSLDTFEANPKCF